MSIINQISAKVEENMKHAIESLQRELRNIRTGRANPNMLDGILVESYGSKMTLNQLASVGTPEARLIEIRPWDVNSISAIEKAIQSSHLDLNPSNDGKVIRIPIPPLTQETRLNLVKHIKKIEEQHKIALRNARRDGIEELKAKEKAKEISEDQLYKSEEDLQAVTNKYIKQIEDIIKHKEAEIMEV